jgi:hypothetical protein
MTASPHMGETETNRSTAPVVAIRGLCKTYAGTPALRNLDLDFLPGEIHAVCGGSGSRTTDRAADPKHGEEMRWTRTAK